MSKEACRKYEFCSSVLFAYRFYVRLANVRKFLRAETHGVLGDANESAEFDSVLKLQDTKVSQNFSKFHVAYVSIYYII